MTFANTSKKFVLKAGVVKMKKKRVRTNIVKKDGIFIKHTKTSKITDEIFTNVKKLDNYH